MVEDLHDAVSANKSYKDEQTDLIACMNAAPSGGASGASHTPAFSFTSFDGIIGGYTSSVKSKMETATTNGGCADHANTMYATLRSVSQTELANLKRANTEYAKLLNTSYGRNFESSVGSDYIIKLYAQMLENTTAGSGGASDSGPAGQNAPARVGINCLRPGETTNTLQDKMNVLNCLVFNTPHSFWQNQPRTLEKSELHSLVRYRDILGYDNWSCSLAPDDFFNPSCLMHDVSWFSLRRFDGTNDDEEDTTIDNAWNSRNAYLADVKFVASLKIDSENRALPIGCYLKPENTNLLLMGACQIWRTEIATIMRIHAMYIVVHKANAEVRLSLKPSSEVLFDVAVKPYFTIWQER